jgi:hypothetical protein
MWWLPRLKLFLDCWNERTYAYNARRRLFSATFRFRFSIISSQNRSAICSVETGLDLLGLTWGATRMSARRRIEGF